MNHCKICKSETIKIFNTKILNKYPVDYFQCTFCDFVQTEKTYWLEESYLNPMNLTDTGIMVRNQRSARIVTSIIFLFFNKSYQFLDYAGGYGVFTRIMRDKGFNFYWDDPHTKNVISRGFEKKDNQKFDVVTTFESFEHFDNPLLEIEKILKISKNIIFSTELISKTAPDPDNWWYYGKEHGQHIALYTQKSLHFIAKKYTVNYYNINNLHFFSEKKISIIGNVFLKFKFSKHILYMLSFILDFFIESKTFSDMENLKSK
jgi:hypothetical protein